MSSKKTVNIDVEALIGEIYKQSDIEEIKRHLIEIKTELRMVRTLYSFWVEQNLSPEFMEKFLEEYSFVKSVKTKHAD
jgi:hypothetical protein